MDYVLLFNAFESTLWLVIGITLLCLIRSRPHLKGRLLLSAVGFFAFAGTDVVEMQTGAWWRPWWLFVWKAACVVLLLSVGIYHYRSSKTADESDPLQQ